MEENNEKKVELNEKDPNINQDSLNENTAMSKKKKSSSVEALLIIAAVFSVIILLGLYISSNIAYKPIIYIYPEQETEVSVKLGYEDKITCIYPTYNNGWTVTAQSDGTLIDTKTNKKYYSLYYESDNTKKYDGNLAEGFVVSKENVANFLEEKLAILGLNYKEAEEFIIYWLPKLEQKDYVYIRFQTMNEIEENMPLLVSPSPDTLIRIMMEWKSLDNSIDVKEQILTPVTRNGYTVVEWGGTEIK